MPRPDAPGGAALVATFIRRDADVRRGQVAAGAELRPEQIRAVDPALVDQARTHGVESLLKQALTGCTSESAWTTWQCCHRW